jgi:hypothetical protein
MVSEEWIIRKAFIILTCMILVGCTSIGPRTDRAEKSLVEFFNLLSQGKYKSAGEYFGGQYETLTEMNPGINPSDHALLWANACRTNGFACLPVSKITFLESTGSVLSFKVEFKRADGSQFSQGACCGEESAFGVTQTFFIYHVLETQEGKYLVLDLPVYIP